MDAGYIVVSTGGGGVPVFEANDAYKGVAAVIDKDRSASMLAAGFKADMLVILTAVEKVCVNFGKRPSFAPSRRPPPWPCRCTAICSCGTCRAQSSASAWASTRPSAWRSCSRTGSRKRRASPSASHATSSAPTRVLSCGAWWPSCRSGALRWARTSRRWRSWARASTIRCTPATARVS